MEVYAQLCKSVERRTGCFSKNLSNMNRESEQCLFSVLMSLLYHVSDILFFSIMFVLCLFFTRIVVGLKKCFFVTLSVIFERFCLKLIGKR